MIKGKDKERKEENDVLTKIEVLREEDGIKAENSLREVKEQEINDGSLCKHRTRLCLLSRASSCMTLPTCTNVVPR